MIKFNKSHHLIHWWKGTDTLKLVMYPPTKQKLWYVRIWLERQIWKLTEWMIREHWVDHDCLIENLEKFGIDTNKIKVVSDPIWTDKVHREDHEKFTVMFYRPRAGNQYFKDWLYGWDVIKKIMMNNSHWQFYRIDQHTSKFTVILLLQTTDIYIRPNRHDGRSRLAEFCKQNGIPVFHSRKHYFNTENTKRQLMAEIEYHYKLFLERKK